MRYENHLLIILAFIVIMFLFILKQGIISKLLENNFSTFIGTFTFSIYVTHAIFRNLWQLWLCQNYQGIVINYPLFNIVVLYIISIGFGILTYYFVEKPCSKYLKNKFS